MQRHFLALNVLRQAQAHDHHLGLLRHIQRLGQHVGARDRPQELHFRGRTAVEVVKLQAIQPTGLQINYLGPRGVVMHALRHNQQLALKIEPVAGVAGYSQVIHASLGRNQEAGPAHTERRPPLAAYGRPARPLAIDHSIDLRAQWSTLEVVTPVVLRLQSLLPGVAVGRSQIRRRDNAQGRHAFGHSAAACVQDRCVVAKLAPNTLQRRHRLRRCTVIVAQQWLAIIGIGPDHGDALQRLGQRQQSVVLQ